MSQMQMSILHDEVYDLEHIMLYGEILRISMCILYQTREQYRISHWWIETYEQLMMTIHPHDHTDSIISGEIITDSKSDVGMLGVRILYLQMQHEQRQYGTLIMRINDIME